MTNIKIQKRDNKEEQLLNQSRQMYEDSKGISIELANQFTELEAENAKLQKEVECQTSFHHQEIEARRFDNDRLMKAEDELEKTRKALLDVVRLVKKATKELNLLDYNEFSNPSAKAEGKVSEEKNE